MFELSYSELVHSLHGSGQGRSASLHLRSRRPDIKHSSWRWEVWVAPRQCKHLSFHISVMNIEEQSLQVLAAASDKLTAQLSTPQSRPRSDSITDWEERKTLPNSIKRAKVTPSRRGGSQPRPRPLLRRDQIYVFNRVLRGRKVTSSIYKAPQPLFPSPVFSQEQEFQGSFSPISIRRELKLTPKIPEIHSNRPEITFARLDLTSPYIHPKRLLSSSPHKSSFRRRKELF